MPRRQAGDWNVHAPGLRELSRELRKADSRFPRELRAAHRSVADTVVDDARSRGRSLGGVHAHVVAMNSIRASGTQRGAAVLVGGTAAKHGPALGAEFGAYPSTFGFLQGSRREHGVRQFPQWLGNQWVNWGDGVGYMVHPAIRENAENIEGRYASMLDDLLRRAFPDRG